MIESRSDCPKIFDHLVTNRGFFGHNKYKYNPPIIDYPIMSLLHRRFFQGLSLAALVFLVLSALIWSWESVIEWAEGIIAFGFLFFLISSVMKTKHLMSYSDSDECSDIGTLLL